MPVRLLPIEQILTILKETPPRIAARTTGLAPVQLHAPPKLGEWSANEVLAHLRSCATVWGNYIAVIIAEDMPAIRAVSPRTWIKGTDYLQQEFRPAFRAFTKQRASLLALLEQLAPEAWSRSATVTAVGKPILRTVHTYAERLAVHEREHVRQIERIVNIVRVQ